MAAVNMYLPWCIKNITVKSIIASCAGALCTLLNAQALCRHLRASIFVSHVKSSTHTHADAKAAHCMTASELY